MFIYIIDKLLIKLLINVLGLLIIGYYMLRLLLYIFLLINRFYLEI